MRHLLRAFRTSCHGKINFGQTRNRSIFAKWHEKLDFPTPTRTRITPSVLVIGCIPIFTFCLGAWQLRRLKWKLSLTEQLNSQVDREPLDLPDVVNLDILPEFEFRKFNAEGTWDHSRPVLLGPKSKDGVQGYQLITPLVRRDGSTILVDRGNVKILGILRTKLQNKNLFTPENKPETGEWYWFDLNQLAEYFGKNNKALQPVFLEEVFDGNTGQIADMIAKGIPVGRSSQIELRNMHATYAVTWFSLSFATTLMFIGMVRKRRVQTKRLV